MSKLYLPDIQENALQFSAGFSNDDFIYELLSVYGIADASITKMRQGKEPFMLNNKVHFQPTDGDLEEAIEELKASPKTKKKKSRFLVATDFKRMRAVDIKTGELLDVALEDFFEDYGFFLPWTGREKVQVYEEVEADQKAAQRMTKLFEIIRLDNPSKEPEAIDALNHFFSRLIFCYYAEDTGIFEKNAFTNYIEHYTDYDGSNASSALRDIFKTLNRSNRASILNNLKVFPYVNGGLFEEDYKVPTFSSRARRMIIECGKISWAKINPDIFGSMFQGVMDDEIRHELGAHYTSVSNIMKVINPLFMDELREEFEKACGYEKKKTKIGALQELHDTISRIKIFDPACGSGNFLITAYKELRYLEMQIIEVNHDITGPGHELGAFSIIEVSQFYGIELNPFAVELAKLSMWLAEHQVNMEFQRKFTTPIASIPLRNSANITAGNACRIDWDDVCPRSDNDEIYVLGNPPYLGARQQSKEQKRDLQISLTSIRKYTSCDYISAWFYKASRYIRNFNIRYAFVTTNSITQGEQVALLWPHLLDGLDIEFAYRSFKWKNNSKNPAGVTCAIICVGNFSKRKKSLYDEHSKIFVDHINPYLLPYKDIYVTSEKKSISKLPPISYGSFALDDGNYTLTKAERDEILQSESHTTHYIRKFVGAAEMIRGIDRYCIWLRDSEGFDESAIISSKIAKVREWRMNSKRKQTRELAETPHLFAEIRQPNCDYIAFPTVSSERREYIPIDYQKKDVIASNQIYVVSDASPHIFALLTSRMNMVWVKTVGGRLKTDYRYSASICYNTFPIPNLSDLQINELEELSHCILESRDMHPDKTLAQLYDPDKMPQNLRDAHNELDMAVDRIYRKQPFKNDDERLVHLFMLYEKMTKGEKK